VSSAWPSTRPLRSKRGKGQAVAVVAELRSAYYIGVATFAELRSAYYIGGASFAERCSACYMGRARSRFAYGQWRQPLPQHVPRARKKSAVST